MRTLRSSNKLRKDKECRKIRDHYGTDSRNADDSCLEDGAHEKDYLRKLRRKERCRLCRWEDEWDQGEHWWTNQPIKYPKTTKLRTLKENYREDALKLTKRSRIIIAQPISTIG